MTNQDLDQTRNSSDVFTRKHVDNDIINDGWTKYHTGILVGLLGGFIVLLGAIFINVFDLFSGDKPHGIWLFFIIYPLFAIGAHCFDKVSELRKQSSVKTY